MTDNPLPVADGDTGDTLNNGDTSPETSAEPIGNANGAAPNGKPGLPLWMPLLGLLGAFLFAVFIGARICPTLYSVVLPPEPPLPDGQNTLLLHEAKGTGLDEYLYSTSQDGCNVAQYYKTLLTNCVYDPDAGCASNPHTLPLVNADGIYIGQCSGTQTVGAFHVRWTVYISTAYRENGLTHYRVIREIGN